MTKCIDWRFRPPIGEYWNSMFYASVREKLDITPEMVYDVMDDAGIEIGVCPFRKGMDNSRAEEMQDISNGRLKAFIHIDPWEMDQGLKDIDDYVVNGTVAGVCCEPGQIFIKKQVHIDDEMMFPLYEKCEKEGILLSMTFGGMLNRDPEYYMPHYMAHVCDMFPKLKIVAAHGGWPWVTGICHVAYNHEFLFISPDAYLTKQHPGYQDYATAANHYLKQKMIFGTAYAWSIDPKPFIQDYTDLLDPDVAPLVLYHNAAGLLGLEEIPKYYNLG